MTTLWMRENWALLAATALVVVIGSVALRHWLSTTAYFRLRHARRNLVKKRRAFRKRRDAAERAASKVARLERRSDKVRPRHLEDARGIAEDTLALARIAHDQQLTAENLVRRVIVEEFPPARQGRLREKYEVAETPDKRPFTF